MRHKLNPYSVSTCHKTRKAADKLCSVSLNWGASPNWPKGKQGIQSLAFPTYGFPSLP